MAIIPVHQWTHDGDEVLIVRQVNTDGASSHGFVWPLTVGATVGAPDWDATPECGHGLHGWPWGLAIGDGAEPNYTATWLVVGAAPADVVDLGGKVKVRRCVVRHVGTWVEALSRTLGGRVAYVQQASYGASYRGASSAAGDYGASSATGDRGASSATGDYGASSATGVRGASSATGDRGASSATGYRGTSSATGDRGASSATGYRGTSSATGVCGAAVVTGISGRAQAGPHGVIALAYWNARAAHAEMRCARVVDGANGTLKPLTWYRLNDAGEFVECD